MRKASLFALFLVFSLLLGVVNAQAANIHLHFFESIDTTLEEQRFQTFSFFADAGEPITIVSYGLQDGAAPSLVLLDTMGATLKEDLNTNGLPVATVEATLPQAGIYTFVVSRVSEQGGVFRVMVFSGDPLKAGQTYMDTIDPLLPARAYLLAGIGDINTEIQLEVVPDASGNPVPNEIYVSRGTDQDPPPLAERLNPGSVFSWVNEAGVTFYTITARATPELMPTSGKPRGLLSLMAQTLDLGFVKIQVAPENTPQEEPSEDIVFIRRDQLIGQITYPTAKLAGPGGNYRQQDITESGTQFEIVAQSGNYFLVVDPNSLTGGSWIRKDRFELVPDPLIQALRESHLASNPEYAELIENIVEEIEEANTFESLEALAPVIDPPPITSENRGVPDDADDSDDEELDDSDDDDDDFDDDDSDDEELDDSDDDDDDFDDFDDDDSDDGGDYDGGGYDGDD